MVIAQVHDHNLNEHASLDIVPERTMISNQRGALKHAQKVSRNRRETRLFQ
jgi:hypothetical protein